MNVTGHPDCVAREREAVRRRWLDALDADDRCGYPEAFEAATNPPDPLAGAPDGLPATLAEVEDVGRVCEATGMTQAWPGRWETWADDLVRVIPSYGISGVAQVRVGDRSMASVPHNAPALQLWAAIWAARTHARSEMEERPMT